MTDHRQILQASIQDSIKDYDGENIQAYEQVFSQLITQQYPLSKKSHKELKYLQKLLQLTDEEVEAIETRLLENFQPNSTNQSSSSFAELKIWLELQANKLSLGKRGIILLSLALGLSIIGVIWLSVSQPTGDSRGVVSAQSRRKNLYQVQKKLSLSNFLTKQSVGVNSLALSSDGKTIVIGSDKGKIIASNLITEKSIASLNNNSSSAINALAISPDGNTIVSGDVSGKLIVWDLNKKKLIHTGKDHSPFSILSVAISPDGKKIVSSDLQGNIKVWDLQQAKTTHTLIGHSAGVNSVAISPDSKKIVSVSNDKTIRVWELQTGKEITGKKIKPMKENQEVFTVLISPDGEKIFTGDIKGNIRKWDLNTGEPLDIYQTHSQKVSSLALDRQGKILVSGSNDQTVNIWNLKKKNTQQLPEKHKLYVSSVAISSDGKTIVSGSKNEIKVWQLKK